MLTQDDMMPRTIEVMDDDVLDFELVEEQEEPEVATSHDFARVKTKRRLRQLKKTPPPWPE